MLSVSSCAIAIAIVERPVVIISAQLGRSQSGNFLINEDALRTELAAIPAMCGDGFISTEEAAALKTEAIALHRTETASNAQLLQQQTATQCASLRQQQNKAEL